jgi:hypothetical protein
MNEPFRDVELVRQYPMQDVADHEVLMAFRNDSDAIDFREWWHLKGAALFNKWLLKSREEP